MREKETTREHQKSVPRWKMAAVLVLDLVLACGILVCGTVLFVRWYHDTHRPELSALTAPDWYTQDFLTRNPYSRPGIKREEIRDIVVHYVANPGTSASQNRSYFESLAHQTGSKKVSASSHYIIGIDGEILQLIPLDEVAYANYPRNEDTVSIECCHPDDSGEFTQATKESLVKLTAWLCQELNLTEKHVIRHYDVVGKNCPKYYVEDEKAWAQLLGDIKKTRKES